MLLILHYGKVYYIRGCSQTRGWSPKFATGQNVIIDIDQKLYEWPGCSFARMMYSKRDHFGKKTAWSLFFKYFFELWLLWYLAQSQILVTSLYVEWLDVLFIKVVEQLLLKKFQKMHSFMLFWPLTTSIGSEVKNNYTHGTIKGIF